MQENLPTLCFYNVSKGKERAGSDGSYYNDEEVCHFKAGLEIEFSKIQGRLGRGGGGGWGRLTLLLV